jgi:ribosomal protein S17
LTLLLQIIKDQHFKTSDVKYTSGISLRKLTKTLPLIKPKVLVHDKKIIKSRKGQTSEVSTKDVPIHYLSVTDHLKRIMSDPVLRPWLSLTVDPVNLEEVPARNFNQSPFVQRPFLYARLMVATVKKVKYFVGDYVKINSTTPSDHNHIWRIFKFLHEFGQLDQKRAQGIFHYLHIYVNVIII